MRRFFEKISFEQFDKDTGLPRDVYDKIKLPRRATKRSSGYDFFAYSTFILRPGSDIKYYTGVKASMYDDEWLAILVRGGAGFKFNIRLMNQVGNVDSDYYNNRKNEGHICIALMNEGNKLWRVEKGEAFAQGIFLPYLTVEDEEEIKEEREGGFGSTTKK